MVKCQTPVKKESKTWTKYIPTNSRSYLDWYFCDRKSGDYPLRDVSGQGKMEPHYEDGTFNACASCNQRYLNKAKKNGERYVFFFTEYKGQNKVLKKRFGRKYCITGYFEIGKTKNVNWGYAIQSKKTCFYSMKDSYPLEKILMERELRHPRYARKHLSVEDTEKILKHFSGKKNRVLDYIRETKTLYL
jgi:hypothetical protein